MNKLLFDIETTSIEKKERNKKNKLPKLTYRFTFKNNLTGALSTPQISKHENDKQFYQKFKEVYKNCTILTAEKTNLNGDNIPLWSESLKRI